MLQFTVLTSLPLPATECCLPRATVNVEAFPGKKDYYEMPQSLVHKII